MLPWLLALALLAAAACAVGGGDGEDPAGSDGSAGTVPDAQVRTTPGQLDDVSGEVDYVIGEGRAVPPEGVFLNVAVSKSQSCGVRDSGRIECWGAVWAEPPEGRFVSVSLAGEHGCAIRTDGSLGCWASERLADHPWYRSAAEVPQRSFVDVWAPALCAVRDSGQIECWGETWTRGHGRDRVGPPEGRFVGIIRGTNVGRVCALGADGGVACWGEDADEGYGRYRMPLGRFSDMDMAHGHGCAVRVEGSVVCWPLLSGGDVPVLDVSGVREGEFSSVQVLRGAVCALGTVGDIECWGNEEAAGHGSRLGSFVQFDASDDGYCAVDALGWVGCWGAAGDSGGWIQWGQPEGQFSQVSAVDGVGCGVRSDTTIGCWPPRLDFGNPYRWTMSQLPAEPGFVSARVGFGSVCAVRADTTVWCRHLRDGHEAAADEGGFAEAWPTEHGFCGLRTDGTAYCSQDWFARDLPEGRFSEFFVDGRCGLAPDGRFDCWGFDDAGPPPEGVGPLASAASAGGTMCGVDIEGSLACWSADERGSELVDPRLVYGEPVQAPFERVLDGLCLVDAMGTLAHGCLTADTPGDSAWIAYSEPPGTRFLDFARAGGHACAIRTDGTVACWGANADIETITVVPGPRE